MYTKDAFRAGLLSTFLVSLLFAGPASAGPREMTPVDILNLPSLQSPSVSPDGKKVAYVKYISDWKENKRIADLWYTELPSNTTRQLTFDNTTEEAVSWSPDGNYISYLAEPESSYKKIYLYSVSSNKSVAVSNHKSDIKKYLWSKDSRYIYFLANERTPKKIRKRKKSKDDMVPYDVSLSHRHVWRLDIDTKNIIQITKGDYFVTWFSLSPDNSFIAFRRARELRIDDKHLADIWTISVKGGTPRRITNNKYAERYIQISPDSKKILFISDVNKRGEPYYDANLFVVSIQTGQITGIGLDKKFEVEEAYWSKSSNAIYVQANMGVRSELWEFGVGNNSSRQLTNGDQRVREWSYSPLADKHVFKLTTSLNPGDIWIMPGGGGEMTAVTSIFAKLGEKYRLPEQKLVRWKSYDGTLIEGLLSLPLNYRKNKRYPLVAHAHGGPRSSDQYGQFRWRTFIPVFAAKGYAYFSVNYRGGRGYGDNFMRDMVNGYFNHSHLDMMSGIDYMVKQGIADPNKLAGTGWSAGGHMMNKLITFTNRFKAVCSGAGAVDWVSMYGESDTRYSRSFWFGGSPWQENAPLDVYREHSPLKDMWKAKTPTIIFAGEKDKRVPPTQSILLYRALQDFGVPSLFYLAKREKHGFAELRHRLFKINAQLKWFERYVTGRNYKFQKVPKEQFDKYWLQSQTKPPANRAPNQAPKKVSSEEEED